MDNIFTAPRGRNFCNYLEQSSEPLGIDGFPKDFLPIVQLFSDDCGSCLNQVMIQNNRLFIKGGKGKDENELMLRFGDRQLVVARIAFVHQREGKMTELYGILKDIQKEYNLKAIEMEACETDASEGWCKKFKFKELENKCFVEDI